MEGRKEDFFFEKKKQKTFVNFAWSTWHSTFPANSKSQKFFGSFFQKRTAFSVLPCYLRERPASKAIP
jgi:hypothetical protein